MKPAFFICLFSFLAFFGYSETHINATDSPKDTPHERQAFRQRMQTQRVAYFTEKMSLTPAEAEKFWPIYNNYYNERENLRNEFIQKTHKKNDSGERSEFDVSNLSDADAKKLVANEAKRIEMELKLHNELTNLFSPQRVLAFYDAERSFQRELMNTRNRRDGMERHREETLRNPREAERRR
jgi:hypothetical protein